MKFAFIIFICLLSLSQSWGQTPLLMQFPASKTLTKWLADTKGRKTKKELVIQKDSKGNIVRREEYTDGGSICFTIKYEYKNGLMTKKIQSWCSLKRSEYAVYAYDNLKRLVEEREYDDSGKLQARRVNTYKGISRNKIATDNYSNSEKTPYATSTFTYFSNNLLKKEVQNAGGSWFQTNNYQYDVNRHLIYEDAEGDGGVGVVKQYYTYKDGLLISGIVDVPDTGKQHYIYEIK